MKIFLVGGYVRDEILGIESHEKDWVVIGGTEQDMLDKGFISVGKSFPVFLHPVSKEEYALARKEFKTDPGHKGFRFDVNSEITIEEDLYRRDLTVNAIAKSETGELSDPYGGLKDLENRVLRHISPAFKDDPLRVYRVASFYTYLTKFNFKIHSETIELMQEISKSDEINNLSFERIWMETQKCLAMENSHLFFEVLKKVGALYPFSTDLDKFHKNINTLKNFDKNKISAEEKWAILSFDLQLNKDTKIPNSYKKMSKTFIEFSKTLRGKISSKLILEALMKTDSFRNKENAKKIFNLYNEFFKIDPKLKNLNLEKLLEKLIKIKPKKISNKNSKEIKLEIYEKRIALIKEVIGE